MAKKKQQQEETLEDIVMSQNLAFARSATYLEEAGEVAVNSRNIEGMLMVAKGWMELGDMMDSGPGQEPGKRAKLGFHANDEEE
jgi:hypothetical protein